MEPAILVGFVVEVGVQVTINLKAVAIIAPGIDSIVIVGVRKLTQHLAIGSTDDPGYFAVDFLCLNGAIIDFSCCGHVKRNALLNRVEL